MQTALNLAIEPSPSTSVPGGITFWAPGIPQPGGSKKAFYNPKAGRAYVVEDAKKNKPWRATVQAFAMDAHQGKPLEGPLVVEVVMVMPRPAGHFGTKGVRPGAPRFPAVRPDASKLWRSTEDALSGILWRDDSQIVDQHVRKIYGEKPGALITVWPA